MFKYWKIALIVVLIILSISTFIYSRRATTTQEVVTREVKKPLSTEDQKYLDEFNRLEDKKEENFKNSSMRNHYRPNMESRDKTKLEEIGLSYLYSPNNKNWITMSGDYTGSDTHYYYGKGKSEKIDIDFKDTHDAWVTWLDDDRIVMSFDKFKFVTDSPGFKSLKFMESADDRSFAGVYVINVVKKNIEKIESAGPNGYVTRGYAIYDMDGNKRIAVYNGQELKIFSSDLKVVKTFNPIVDKNNILIPLENNQKGYVRTLLKAQKFEF
ncbi:MAG: hypothetical protein ACRCXZ_05120 [Patescibacteria group bacterium]